MARRYELRQRAKSKAKTREKIIEAAMELHQAKGPAATSMRDVAERAGVGTVTVYRHFADDMDLLGACSGAYFQRHPFPDIETWQHVQDPQERFRLGMRQSYAFHRETEPMIARVIDEVRDLPIIEPYEAFWRRAADVLLAAFPESRRRDRKLKAGIALALRFETWSLLTRREALDDAQAVDLMTRLICEGRRPAGKPL